MSRPKKLLTIEQWIEHSPNLFKHMGSNKRKIQKELKALLDEANEKSPPDTDIKNKIVNKLNDYSDKIGDYWSPWINRINQKGDDEKRNKLYLTSSNNKKMEDFFSGDIKDESTLTSNISQLLGALNNAGIKDTNALFDLIEVLKPFADAALHLSFTEQYNNEALSSFSVLIITKLLILELKKNGVESFKDIYLIQKEKHYAERLKYKNEKISVEKQEEIKLLRDEITSLKSSLLKQENENKELNKKITQYKQHLKKINSAPKEKSKRNNLQDINKSKVAQASKRPININRPPPKKKKL